MPTPSEAIERLLAIMARLRGPGGCPWDREQTLASLRPYVLEETYEVLEAIDTGDPREHCEELGDLLLQIVFQSQLTKEAGQFAFEDVAEAISGKLVSRHPHVFGTAEVKDAEGVLKQWAALKKKEKEAKGGGKSVLEGVPRDMPGAAREGGGGAARARRRHGRRRSRRDRARARGCLLRPREPRSQALRRARGGAPRRDPALHRALRARGAGSRARRCPTRGGVAGSDGRTLERGQGAFASKQKNHLGPHCGPFRTLSTAFVESPWTSLLLTRCDTHFSRVRHPSQQPAAWADPRENSDLAPVSRRLTHVARNRAPARDREIWRRWITQRRSSFADPCGERSGRAGVPRVLAPQRSDEHVTCGAAPP